MFSLYRFHVYGNVCAEIKALSLALIRAVAPASNGRRLQQRFALPLSALPVGHGQLSSDSLTKLCQFRIVKVTDPMG
jgi:hypothetical protein